MSESSISDKSLSFIPALSLEETADEQLNINYEIKIRSADEIKQSMELSIEQSLMKNQTVDDLKQTMKNSIQNNYPLTEKSKREKAAKFRKNREMKSELIKKINETITHDVEVIKVLYVYYL